MLFIGSTDNNAGSTLLQTVITLDRKEPLNINDTFKGSHLEERPVLSQGLDMKTSKRLYDKQGECCECDGEKAFEEVQVKVKLFLCLTKHHAMKTFGEVEI
jgi:hypothetical protein